MNEYLVQAVADAAGELHALGGESQRELIDRLEAVALLLELDRLRVRRVIRRCARRRSVLARRQVRG